MRSIDIHAHISPQPFIDAMEAGENWHGITSEAVASHRHNPRTVWSPEARLADMDSLGVDVQVLSTNAVFYYYDKDTSAVAAMARDCNEYVSGLTKEHPGRFEGLRGSARCRCKTSPHRSRNSNGAWASSASRAQ